MNVPTGYGAANPADSPLRGPATPRRSQSRAGQAVALSLQLQLQRSAQTLASPASPTAFDPLTSGRNVHATNKAPDLPGQATPRSPFHLAGYMRLNGQGTSAHEFPVARVDPWPLTLSPTASPRSKPTKPFDPEAARDFTNPEGQHAQPLDKLRRPEHDAGGSSATASPRRRQVQARHKAKLIEESKSQPLLLQELQHLLHDELQQFDNPTAPPTEDCRSAVDPAASQPSLRRLQVFRAVFQKLIEGFSVYAPLLTLIRDEYERVISMLRVKCEQIPRLHAQLQTLETQCLHDISLHSLEQRTREMGMKKQLKQTQGRLTACAAQNASLREQIEALQREISGLEQRSEGLQRSNHTLVSSIKRHDETLQQVHQRSVDEGQAMQQITHKYYHACDEITELKKTIAHLEEKVDGVQVAADRATIALLTKELQELQSLRTNAPLSAAVSSAPEDAPVHQALNRAFVRAFQSVGAPVSLPALLEAADNRFNSAHPTDSVTRNSPTDEMVAKVASDIQHKLLQLKQHHAALLPPPESVVHSSTTNQSAVFLTEPPEKPTNEAGDGLLLMSAIAPLNIPAQDYITCRGTGNDVPEYLQFDGVVRNLHFGRMIVEQLVAKVWDLQDELTASRAKSNSTRRHSRGDQHASVRDADLHRRGKTTIVPLRVVFATFLQRNCAVRAEMAEMAYNLAVGMTRFAATSSACRLFQLVLECQAPDDARYDQVREINVIYEALLAIDRERQSGVSASPSPPVPPGFVSLADVVRSLRFLFPWKTDEALSQLYRSLLEEQRGSPLVDYAALLRLPHQSVHQTGSWRTKAGRVPFIECLKSQYVDDIVAFRRHLQQQVKQELGTAGAFPSISSTGSASIEASLLPGEDRSESDRPPGAQMISLLKLRQCLQRCDPAKPVQEINSVLVVVSGFSMEQVLTHDDMMVDGRRVIECLPTLLVRPSGKFPRPPQREEHVQIRK